MLDKIRERFHGIIGWGLLVIVVVPLVITFGQMDWGSAGGNFAARVNGEDIPLGDFQRVYQNQLLAQEQAIRGPLSPELQQELKKSVLNSLILNKVVTQFVRDAGYNPGDALLSETIRANPAFAVGGQFSMAAYESALSTQGLTPASYEAQQRSSLAVQQLQQGIVASAFATNEEFRRLLALDGERRDVSLVLLDPRRLGGDAPVTDQDIQTYYSSNPDQFRSQETVDIDYVELSLDDMAKDYVPDEAALRKAYDADPTRFRTEPERRVRHILIPVAPNGDEAAARAKAADVARQLAGGADFAALARKYSGDPGSAQNGGELGWAGKGTYAEPFEAAVFSLQKGQVSDPVRTEFGFHIIQVEDIRDGSGRGFEQVRDELAAELKKQKAQDEFYALADRLDDLALENPASLEPVATQTSLPLRHVAGFTRDGGGPFGANPKVAAAVFTEAVLEGGENSPLIQLDDGHAVIIRVAEHHPPAPRALAEVRAEITDRLRALRGSNAATLTGETIMKRAQSGEDLATAARASGQAVSVAPGLQRRSPGLPPELLAAVFRAPKPAGGVPTVQGVPLEGGGYAVFSVTAVIPGDPATLSKADLDRRRDVLRQQFATAEIEGLAAELRSSAKEFVSPSVLGKPDEQP